MLYSRFFTALMLGTGGKALPGILEERAACNADNCLRAVRGTAAGVKPGPSQASQDCQSFFQETTTIGSGEVFGLTHRGHGNHILISIRFPSATHATALPSYLTSACTGDTVSRYSSACSCAGITSYNTITVTPTTTASPTSLPTPGDCSTFIVRATSGPFASSYFNLPSGSSSLDLSAATESDATKFVLCPNRQVGLASDTDNVWANFPGSGGTIEIASSESLPAFDPNNHDVDFGEHAIFCNITATDGKLQGAPSCELWEGLGYAPTVFQSCPGGEGDTVIVDAVVDDAFDTSCVEIRVEVVPAC